jgi:hypothetical protein
MTTDFNDNIISMAFPATARGGDNPFVNEFLGVLTIDYKNPQK